ESGNLSVDDFNTVMSGAAPSIKPDQQVTMDQLRQEDAADPSTTTVTARRFDINGYQSSDILRFKNEKTGREVLYIPGSPQPFHAFDDESQLQQWVAKECQDSQQRAMLDSHFSLYNLQDGTSYSGVGSGLEKLGNGTWKPSDSIDLGDGVRGGVRKDVING